MASTEGDKKPVITRFAPSPTGALHVGGARTALFNWAYARGRGGRFILRIEDTDKARSTDEATRGIVRDLQWLGIDWDEGPDADAHGSPSVGLAEGKNQLDPRRVGPFFQSKRLEIYRAHLHRLIDAGRAYEDGGAYRFRMPGADVSFHDEVRGDIIVGAKEIDDFVICKSDGFPTYHFAVVVDDALMGVTHVIRGQEHLSNTPKHVALQEALGFPRPTYAHLPLIFNPDGSKMSKRDKAKAARKAAFKANYADLGAAESDNREHPATKEEIESFFCGSDAALVAAFNAFMSRETDDLQMAARIAEKLGLILPEIDVHDFRGSGYLPDVLCNYLALLGWNPGGDVERFDKSLLVEKFDLSRVQKGDAKFDREKLASFNADTIRQMPGDQLAAAVWSLPGNTAAFDASHRFNGCDDPRFLTFIEAYRPRMQTLRDPLVAGAYFFREDDAIEPDEKAVNKVLLKNDGEGLKLLAEFGEALKGIEPWSGAAAHELIKSFCEQRGVGMGAVAQPLRVAVSGGTVTPPIDATLEILGKESTLKRIEVCLTRCGVKA